MKPLWDFPSRAAAIEELGVEGLVAAAVREQWSRLSKQPSAVPLDKTGKHSLASNRAASFGSARDRLRRLGTFV